MTKLFYNLSTVFMVDSKLFAKASAAEQTATIMSNTTNKPVLFSDNIEILKDRRHLRDKLLSGGDASVEMELQGIELSADEMTALSMIRPILERMGFGKELKYQFTVDPENHTPKSRLHVRSNSVLVNGYTLTKPAAQKMWHAATEYWLTGRKTVKVPESIDGHYNTAFIHKNSIVFGCQKISREDCEYIAQKLELVNPVYES